MKLIIAMLAALAASASAFELSGTANCPNKCEKVFDRTQYAISDQPGMDTFEFRSCVLGCGQCDSELTSGSADDTCFNYCKDLDYKSMGIRKGIIEPDKACMIGCMINTCQEVCLGGTADPDVTPANQYLWWGQPGATGCSIKTGLGYIQNANYANPNSPQGSGATEGVEQCCTNAMNLCQYTGPMGNNVNYKNVQRVARRSCKTWVPSQKDADICDFFNTPANCGTQGMPI
jgi:hypothetical protein